VRATASAPRPKRGEIWRVNFDPSVGAEQTKVRPALVLSRDDAGALPLRVVVPLTTWQPHLSAVWLLSVEADATNGLSRTSVVDCFQPRSFDLGRFVSKLGELDVATVEEAARTVAEVLGVDFGP
jgi:mRNA interferase MazF